MNASPRCKAFTKSFEKLRLLAYDDARPDHVLKLGDPVYGTLTVGWGHTGGDVSIGLEWTQEIADAAFDLDYESAEIGLSRLVLVSLSQGQYDCLADFVFNAGAHHLEASTLLEKLNAGDYVGARNQLYWVDAAGKPHGWIYQGKQMLPGLIRRRQGEQALWDGLDPLALAA